MQIEWTLKKHTMAPMDISTLMTASSMLANEKREMNGLLHDLKLGLGHKLHLLENTYDLRIQDEYNDFLDKIDKMTMQKQDLTAADNFFLQEIGIQAKAA